MSDKMMTEGACPLCMTGVQLFRAGTSPLFPRAVSAGFAATVVFTLAAYYAAPLLTGFPLDIGAYLADKLGGNAMLGAMLHYLAGTVVFPLGYVVVGPFLPGWPTIKGLAYGVVVWLAAMLVIFPLTGAGLFMSNMVGLDAVVASLIAHLIYGAVLGALGPDFARVP
jgi:Family of unknown function (DUF6789)